MAHLEALNFQMPSAFKDTWRGALAGHGLLPRELSRGFRQGPWVKNAQSNSCRTCILWASLSFRSGDLKDWSQICLRIVKLPRNAYACLHREPVNTNVSASAGSTWVPHTRRFLHFKKKTWLTWELGDSGIPSKQFWETAGTPILIQIHRLRGWFLCVLTGEKHMTSDKAINTWYTSATWYMYIFYIATWVTICYSVDVG